MKFKIEKEFFDIFEEAKIGVIIAKNIDNKNTNEVVLKALEDSQNLALKHIPNDDFTSNEVIKTWRDAFTKFKKKKGSRCSIEALLKRVKLGNRISSINPLVDLYNSISLKYALPCGAEDIDKFVGDLKLGFAKGDEKFLSYGDEASTTALENELVYKDEESIVCRSFNYREAVRTMITQNTKNAFLCIETIDKNSSLKLEEALLDLKSLISDNLKAECSIYVLNKDNNSIEF